jgi:hypothetical protein
MRGAVLLALLLIVPYGFWRALAPEQHKAFWAFTGRHIWFAIVVVLVLVLAILISTGGISMRVL